MFILLFIVLVGSNVEHAVCVSEERKKERCTSSETFLIVAFDLNIFLFRGIVSMHITALPCSCCGMMGLFGKTR